MKAMLLRIVGNLGILAALAAWLLASGCATTEPPNSDLPWNSPQPWEGSPLIPGLDGDR